MPRPLTPTRDHNYVPSLPPDVSSPCSVCTAFLEFHPDWAEYEHGADGWAKEQRVPWPGPEPRPENLDDHWTGQYANDDEVE